MHLPHANTYPNLRLPVPVPNANCDPFADTDTNTDLHLRLPVPVTPNGNPYSFANACANNLPLGGIPGRLLHGRHQLRRLCLHVRCVRDVTTGLRPSQHFMRLRATDLRRFLAHRRRAGASSLARRALPNYRVGLLRHPILVAFRLNAVRPQAVPSR